MDNLAQPATLSPVDPLRISSRIGDPYHNQRIASVNDHEIRMSVMTSAFPWHSHPGSDETFFCVDGELVIELDEQEITLKPGEFMTVPRGVRHRTRPKGERSVNLTFEKLDSETLFD